MKKGSSQELPNTENEERFMPMCDGISGQTACTPEFSKQGHQTADLSQPPSMHQHLVIFTVISVFNHHQVAMVIKLLLIMQLSTSINLCADNLTWLLLLLLSIAC
ncbi:hypothetical protein BsWGS_07899 [Bradybaena similaris]